MPCIPNPGVTACSGFLCTMATMQRLTPVAGPPCYRHGEPPQPRCGTVEDVGMRPRQAATPENPQLLRCPRMVHHEAWPASLVSTTRLPIPQRAVKILRILYHYRGFCYPRETLSWTEPCSAFVHVLAVSGFIWFSFHILTP